MTICVDWFKFTIVLEVKKVTIGSHLKLFLAVVESWTEDKTNKTKFK